MTKASATQFNEQFDLVGIGFGPAGIALAAAIEDLGETTGLDLAKRVRLFERKSEPGWQTGLLFRNTDIQHHFLRDLATPRDPRSRFTFANYLKEHNRLFEFGSLVYGASGGAVGRIEWSDYVAWAARLLDDYVTYDTPVDNVRLIRNNGQETLCVTTPHGEVVTRAVAFCAGQPPHVPPVFQEHLGAEAFHTSCFLRMIERFDRSAPLRICVVGAGQTSAEVLLYLHSAFPRGRIVCLQRAIGFHLGDHSPFIQRMFHPKESDFFYALPSDSKHAVHEEVARANYNAVDRDVASALYRILYEDDLLGDSRIQLITGAEIDAVHKGAEARFEIETTNRFDGSAIKVKADVIVLCTGFAEEPFPRLLKPLSSIVQMADDGGPVVGYDFSLSMPGHDDVMVFIPGAGQTSHGIGASASFSLTSLKAERVVGALRNKNLLTGG